jgi:hypothetical protein
MESVMHEVKIFFPGVKTSNGSTFIRTERMLLRSLKSSADVIRGLRERHTLHSIDTQLDVEEDISSEGGYISLSDAITGDHIVSAMW